ncbi:hypothetical protein BKA64DRAFT_582870, partial [Cadophora sp. MPI-SDFR-AT-0126]
LFSGPYGTSIVIDEYKSILIVASGFSIAAHLLYLKKLIYDYSSHRVQARRIQSLLNNILEDNKLDNSYISL